MAVQLWSQPKFSISGYYKNFSILFMMPAYRAGDSILNEPDMGAVNNRLRIKLNFNLSSQLNFYFAYDFSPRIQDPSLFESDTFMGSFEPLEYRFSDIRKRLYPKPGASVSSFGLWQNLDRLVLTIKTRGADIFVGRQAVTWGSARIINPTDIIAPFAFNELDKEERRGVDALRLRFPLGMMDELDVGFVAGKNFNFDKNALWLRGKIYRFKTDISALLISFRKHLLAGLDVARSLGGAGFWLEAAYVVTDFFRQTKAKNNKNYLRASVGLDYNLTSKTYGFIEYHFNSAGSNEAAAYSKLFRSAAYRDGSVYLMGKHYLSLGSTCQLTGLVALTGLLIANLSDQSLIFSPLIEYNIAENIYLAGGAYIGLGKKAELTSGRSSSRQFLFRSEFGSYPDMVFTSFRVYF